MKHPPEIEKLGERLLKGIAFGQLKLRFPFIYSREEIRKVKAVLAVLWLGRGVV